ncbi:MAG: ribosomal protein S19 family protein [Candidatus Pacearchaeota archaeon]
MSKSLLESKESEETQEITGKKKKFRGKTEEELLNMSINEFAELLTARERRSLIRNEKAHLEFIKKATKKIMKGKMPKTHKRDLVIIPKFLGWTIGVHNGKEFVPVKITFEMLGHRLGEFVLTRKFVKHGAAGIGATKGTAHLSVK